MHEPLYRPSLATLTDLYQLTMAGAYHATVTRTWTAARTST